MIRKIITIDEEKCVGCTLCVNACHEDAIVMVDGKAKLLRDDYCDGLGDCLPACPTNAITFEEREALEYDELAVQKNKENKQQNQLNIGCPSTVAKNISRSELTTQENSSSISVDSQLRQWPIQIKLTAANATFFNDAHLLIAADCAAYAYGNFHNEFMKNKVTIIGCPKLDEGDYSDKLTSILNLNTIKSVTVVRMEVPCCSGILNATTNALKNSGKLIPWQVVTITTDGRILENN